MLKHALTIALLALTISGLKIEDHRDGSHTNLMMNLTRRAEKAEAQMAAGAKKVRGPWPISLLETAQRFTQQPTTPGCYVTFPSGCPNQVMSAFVWKNDVWGESSKNAKYDQAACEVTRKGDFDEYCGSGTVMKWLPQSTTPGCYVHLPNGCPNGGVSAGWHKDTWGEANMNTGANQEACETQRKKTFDEFCGSSDSQMLWIAPGTSGPYCFALSTTGCPNHAVAGPGVWTQDVWGEQNKNAAADQNACTMTRHEMFNNWCGKPDTQMLWIPPR